ncbi:MAG: hypothetical protein HYT47_00565 [Candidatus Vogelbacteria bacterium]|nr:hypothetical protein [Candidatus Vogelbacteria bacterium]
MFFQWLCGGDNFFQARAARAFLILANREARLTAPSDEDSSGQINGRHFVPSTNWLQTINIAPTPQICHAPQVLKNI